MSPAVTLPKKERIYVGVFLSILVVVVWANVAYQPVVWEKSFQREDTQPYGGKIIHDLLPYLMDGATVEAVDVPPYELLADTTQRNINYVFLTQQFQPDAVEAEALIDFVARGNVVFVAAEAYAGDLAPHLGLTVDYNFAYADTSLLEGFDFADSTLINLENPELKREGGYYYSTELLRTRFEVLPDSLWSRTLIEEYGEPAHIQLGTYLDGGVNYMKITLGEGSFLLSTVPLAFSNYNMVLEGNAEYAYAALSYLPVQTTLWDRYYKPNKPVAQTPLRFVLSSPALKTAYYLGIVLLLLFVLMQIRRKQRVIPVLQPKENTTVEFAHTMGRLYFNRGDHADLAGKMLDQFRHYVQHRLNLPAQSFDEMAVERIAARSGIETREVERLMASMQEMKQMKVVDENQLEALADQLEDFYATAKR